MGGGCSEATFACLETQVLVAAGNAPAAFCRLSSQELEASVQRRPPAGLQKDLAVRFKFQCCGLWTQPTTDSL